MLPLIATTPGALLRQIARRAVARRLALGWTREELARRAGIAVDTLKRFEQTGQVSLERLLKVALALDALREFTTLFPESAPASLADLEARATGRGRRRVRTRGLRSSAIRDAAAETPDAPPRPRAERPGVGEAIKAGGNAGDEGRVPGSGRRTVPPAPDHSAVNATPQHAVTSEETIPRQPARRRRRAGTEAPDAST